MRSITVGSVLLLSLALVACSSDSTGSGGSGGGSGGSDTTSQGGSTSETSTTGGEGGAGEGGAGEGGAGSDGLCEVTNVGDPAECDEDCDVSIDGGADVFQCTISCDPVAQDCGPTGDDSVFYCAELTDGSGACFFDCAEGNVCPGGYVCDEADTLLCIPDAI